MKWWNHKKNNFNYKELPFVINKTMILIGSDPLDGWKKDNAKKIDAWINVSDTKCNSLEKTPWNCEKYWFPVPELYLWSYHHAFWIKEVLDELVFNRKDIKTIYLHCHAGARRSPMSLIFWFISHLGLENGVRAFYSFSHRDNSESLIRSNIKNIKNNGNYGELMPDVELFYKLMNYEQKSFFEIIHKFDRITKGKYQEKIGVPPHFRKLSKYRGKKEYLDMFLNQKGVILLNKKVSYDARKNKSNFMDYCFKNAQSFYNKNNLKISKSKFYTWYANEILKKNRWNEPVIRFKNNKKFLSSLEVVELSTFIKESPSKNFSVNFKNNIRYITFI